MNEVEIKNKIDIIFQRESDEFKAARFYVYKLYYSNSDIKSYICSTSRSRLLYSVQLLEIELDESTILRGDIQWATYSTLTQLYTKIETDAESREIFINYMKKKLFNNTQFTSVDVYSSSLAFYFLMKIGRIIDCMQVLKDMPHLNFQSRSQREVRFANYILEDIYYFMSMEPDYFDDSTLKTLKDTINRIHSQKLVYIRNMIEKRTNLLRYDNVANELKGINEELNIDKEQVIDLICKYGFPKEMESFLLELDKIPESAEWKSINSGMIGNLRAFFEELVKNIAAQIKEKTGLPYPKDRPSNMGNIRKYLREHLGLSEDDDKFIDSYINILHEEGGHAFMSERRYFVLSKNIGIEFALFLMSKLDSFLSSEQ